MPITALDPKTALIVLDLPKGIASRVPPRLLERNRALPAGLDELPPKLVRQAGGILVTLGI